MSSAVLRLNKAFAYWGYSKPFIKMESLGHGAAVVWVSHRDLDPGQISAVTAELGKITGGKK